MEAVSTNKLVNKPILKPLEGRQQNPSWTQSSYRALFCECRWCCMTRFNCNCSRIRYHRHYCIALHLPGLEFKCHCQFNDSSDNTNIGSGGGERRKLKEFSIYVGKLLVSKEKTQVFYSKRKFYF